MNSIAQDAQRLSLLFEYGAIDARAVISWADTWIVQMDSPPDLLLKLSMTMPEKSGDILSYLRGLSSGADFWKAFRNIIPQLRSFVASHPELAENIAIHFYHTAFIVENVPEDLRFICRYDDEFSLARQGIYGDFDTVYKKFVEEMDGATKGS
jgi:hypothetical protein